MGDITSAVSNLGSKTVNLLDDRRDVKQQKHNLYQNYAQTTQNRKNLLEKQLSSRRAKLGSAGISSSASALAVQSRDIDDAYDDIRFETEKYKSKVKQIDRDYRSKMYLQGFDILSDPSKVIK